MSQQFNALPDKLALAVDYTSDFETVVNRPFHSEPNGKCQTSENEDSCDKTR